MHFHGSGGIGDAGTGSDRGEIVADDVGNDVDADSSRCQCPGQLAPAPAGEALTDPVHGRDVETGAEQEGVDRGEIRRADARFWCSDEAGGPTGQEDPDLVGRSHLRRRCRQRGGGGKGVSGRLGVISRNGGEPGVRTRFLRGRHHKAAAGLVPPGPKAFDRGFRHGKSCLAQSQEPDPGGRVHLHPVQAGREGSPRCGGGRGRSVQVGEQDPGSRQGSGAQDRYLVKKFTKCY